jgi:hypothetical protein
MEKFVYKKTPERCKVKVGSTRNTSSVDVFIRNWLCDHSHFSDIDAARTWLKVSLICRWMAVLPRIVHLVYALAPILHPTRTKVSILNSLLFVAKSESKTTSSLG